MRKAHNSKFKNQNSKNGWQLVNIDLPTVFFFGRFLFYSRLISQSNILPFVFIVVDLQ